jgi:hypothetical protein
MQPLQQGSYAERGVCIACGRRREVPLPAFLAQLGYEGCGGLPAQAELLTGIQGVSSQPVRRIVLRR